MIIKENDKKIAFKEILQGSVFSWVGDYYIKTRSIKDGDDDDGGEINCVNLATGDLEYMEPFEIVQNIDAILNIE